jgi:hypothetical protein
MTTPGIAVAKEGTTKHHARICRLFGLLSLAAGWQSTLSFTAKGEDAAEKLAAIEQLFASRFGEAYQTSVADSGDEVRRFFYPEAHGSNSEYENDA